MLTGTIASIKSNIVNANAATGTIRTPSALKNYIEVFSLVYTDLRVAPCGSLVIIQLPD